MVYATTTTVRAVTNITSSELSDSEVSALITIASRQFNSDVNVYHYKEEIKYIDETKDNEINGSNKTFYTKEFPFGDSDDDFDVDTSDITVYSRATDGTETALTVSSITANEGKFVLSSAPSSSVRLFIIYNSVQRSVSDPHALVTNAVTMLTAAYCYSKINVGKAPMFKAGAVSIRRDTEAFRFYEMRYRYFVNAFNDRTLTDTDEIELALE